jgi:uncharacterized protein (TIGR02588 family)
MSRFHIENDPAEPDQERRAPAELLTLALSVAIIAVVLTLVLWLYLRGDDEPPRIVVSTLLDDVREDEGSWYLPIEVRNDGDRTVANARIEAELDVGEPNPQVAEVTVDYLAGGERVRATLIFTSDPSTGTLTARATSYSDP